MSTSISTGVGNLPCFATLNFSMILIKLKIPNMLVWLLLFKIFMTGEPAHTASKEIRVPK